MATVVAGFLSPWPLGWISATPRPLGVDRGHPQWPDLCIFFFFFFLVRWFARERDMATEGGRISPPGRWGGSRPPPVARSIFFFFLVHRKCRRRWAVGGGAISRRWAVDFFDCLIC
jgi:hypothetical protein